MTMMEKRLAGACREFCPSKEVKLRRRERMVHRLESEKVRIFSFVSGEGYNIFLCSSSWSW